MKLLTNHSLKNLNTFRVDVKAKYFVEVTSIEEINEILNNEEVSKSNVLVLGEGANILFTKDFEGLVIKMNIKGIEKVEESENSVVIEAGAGEIWDDLVHFAIEQNYGGIENMALIPGTVGAAAVQNIAAYNENLVDVFVSLEAFILETKSIKTFSKEECEFSYRESIFKNGLREKAIITQVRIKLSKRPEINATYFETGKTYKSKGTLEQELLSFAKPPFSISDIYKAVSNIRLKKLPDPKKIGTAGSFFKNPVITKEKYEELKKFDSDLQCYPVDKLTYPKLDDPTLTRADYVKIPVGRLLDDLGWKGKRIGNVGTFENQALAVVNYGATGEEILNFTKMMKKVVSEKFGIELEEEVQII